MKKQRLFLLFSAVACSLALNAQTLPAPLWKFDFKAGSLNGSEVTASAGTAKGAIGDMDKAAKLDAELVEDADRGTVLCLKNFMTLETPSDNNKNTRCLRINDQKGGSTDVSLVGETDYAISFWVKASTRTTLNGFPHLLIFDNLPFTRGYELRLNAFWSVGANKTSLKITDNAERKVATSYASDSHTFAWTHYLIQRNSGDKKVYLYMNGTLVGSSFYNAEVTAQAKPEQCVQNKDLKNLRFNSLAFGGETFFSDIQAFDKFLTADQIAELVSGVKLQVTTAGYPEVAGTVTESFKAEKDSEVSVTATANEGYTFSHWTDGTKIVSTDASYQFILTDICSLTAIFKSDKAEFLPALSVHGLNYIIKDMKNGEFPFTNRTNLSFQNLLPGMVGMQFTQINANSSYLPGPLPELYAWAETAGYIYTITNDGGDGLPNTIGAWASTNGWEKVDSLSNIAKYGTLVTDVFSVYRKPIAVKTWMQIVQPNVFTGVILMAPSLKVSTGPDGLESSATSDINVYADNQLVLVEGVEGKALVNVYNAGGMQVTSQQIDGNASLTLSQGIYIVKVTTAETSLVKKVIIK